MEFKHTPIMLKEVIENLCIKPNGIYFDGTLGGAGHSSEILKQIDSGLLIGCDKDQDALDVSKSRLNDITKLFMTVLMLIGGGSGSMAGGNLPADTKSDPQQSCQFYQSADPESEAIYWRSL